MKEHLSSHQEKRLSKKEIIQNRVLAREPRLLPVWRTYISTLDNQHPILNGLFLMGY